MRVIKKQALVEYYTKHPQAKDALEDWYAKTEDAQWNNLIDIRQTFNSVDYVGNQHYVFNIKGNDFRLVVVIKFTPQLVYIMYNFLYIFTYITLINTNNVLYLFLLYSIY